MAGWFLWYIYTPQDTNNTATCLPKLKIKKLIYYNSNRQWNKKKKTEVG